MSGKKKVCAVVAALLFASMFHQTVFPANSKVINVPGDYATIQGAIDAANPGDTVFVESSVYREHVTINKTVYLVGADANSTVIDGGGVGNVVTVSVDNVVVKGLTLRNSGAPLLAGIYISNAQNASVTDTIVTNCSMGIRIDASTDTYVGDSVIANNSYVGLRVWHFSTGTVVSGNVIMNNPYGIGLFTYTSDGDVSRNLIANNSIGIGVVNSGNNIVESNNVTQNSMYGILLDDRLTVNNTLAKNQLVGNGYGVYVATKYARTDNEVIHNNFVNNTYFQAFVESPFSATEWNLSYPLGGNYWNDYDGTDSLGGPYENVTGSDGLGDQPYVIGENNIDEYPLMQPFVEQTEPQGQPSYYPYQFALALVLVVFVGLITFFVLRKQLTPVKPEKPPESPEKPAQQAVDFRRGAHSAILVRAVRCVQDGLPCISLYEQPRFT